MRSIYRSALLGTALAVAGALLASPVLARPRDDAMSAAFRCAVIGDTRQWLDCYYGAAQPVRTALGMAPAPAAQQKLASAPPAGNAPPRDGQMRNDILSTAVRCNNFSGDREWLDCFYAAAEPARTVLGLAPGASAQGALPPPPMGAKPLASPRKVNSGDYTARMVSYAFNQRGIFAVTLENGEAWEQLSGDGSRAHWKRPASRYVVRITKGFMGSTNLEVKGSPGLFKVRRLQQ